MIDIYKISLPGYRKESSSRLRKNERSYATLQNKRSKYAKQVKALQDLHRQVYEIYKNAPDELAD